MRRKKHYRTATKLLDAYLSKKKLIEEAIIILESEQHAFASGLRSRKRLEKHFRKLAVVRYILKESLKLGLK